MYIVLILGMLMTGCEWIKEDIRQDMERMQVEQQWRQAHPMEAAHIDLLRGQAEKEDAQAVETYSNLFRPRYQPPQPMLRRLQQCNTMSLGGGMYNTNCW